MLKKLLYVREMPKLKNPFFLAAWPGMGQVAFNAVKHIIEVLSCHEFAYVDSKGIFYPTHIAISNSVLKRQALPFNKFYYWKNKHGKNDLLIFLSNAQPDLSRCKEYSKIILSLAKGLNVKMLFSFASMPQPIDHIQNPGIWTAVTNRRLLHELKKYNFKELIEGKISGMNGLILEQAKDFSIEGVCILAEIPIYTIQIDNPKSSLAVVEAFSRITNIHIDIRELYKQSNQIETQINKLIDYFKISIQQTPIGEEEIESIRKSLDLDKRIPNSVKEKIERLFLHAKKDITKAYELKRELDKWNIYRDYEDRFLDLFKKIEEKNN